MPRDLKVGLSIEQKAFRKNFIGGSDANIIMSGDDAAVLDLWRVKTGQKEPENLDDVLPVVMGQWTEQLNIYWYEKRTGNSVICEGKQLSDGFMSCTLDGIVQELDAVFEAKHVNGFSNEGDVLNRYMPQLHHNMAVTQKKKAVLSMFLGTQKWEVFEVALDPEYMAILIGAETKFWEAVQNKTPPVHIEPPKIITEFKDYDFSTHNEWCSLAVEYLETFEGAKKHDDAKSKLKSIIPADAASVTGAGLAAKRGKNGAIRFS